MGTWSLPRHIGQEKMKIRTCFVSNSSSSSFIVIGTTYDGKAKSLLNAKQLEILKNMGFKPTSYPFASKIILMSEVEEGNDWKFEVVCNQDDVIEELIKAKIPFQACCHYGREHIFWDGKSSWVIEAKNFGVALEGIAEKFMSFMVKEEIQTVPPIRRIPVEEFNH